MNRRREKIGRAVANLLEIPKDLALDLPRITLLGRDEVYIENHRGVIEYGSSRLRINLSRGFLEIEGQELEISTLMPEEIAIVGEINSIRFSD